MKSTSLIEILKHRSTLKTVGITFIESSEHADFLSYSELYDLSVKALATLQHKGLKPGNELVFQVEDNKIFIITFWACLLGGIIPVPLSVGRNKDHRKKLFNVWEVLNNPYLITTEKLAGNLKKFSIESPWENSWRKIEAHLVEQKDLLQTTNEAILHPVKENDIAFIQFSSGSTGSPKGVVLTHKNLITNIKAIAAAAAYSPEDSTLSWMPLTHDMGMIGFHLNPLFSQMNQYLIPTSLFVRRPALWLDKATEYKINILCSPNFGYKYIIKHCPPSGTYGWDLSHVRLLYNGAEPISEKLCDSFLDRMANYGLRKTAMCPVYGLAEATLAVSISSLDAEVLSYQVDRNRVNLGDKVSASDRLENSISFVNVGKAINDCLIRITDNDHLPVADEVIGHLQIKGDNVTAGYYNNRVETQKIITPDQWLDTGDLAFIKEGNVYITGRAKDIIFINGQNYYPHDIEEMAIVVDGVELNKVVVVGYFNRESQRDESIAFVYYKAKVETFVPVAQALKETINIQAGFQLDRVLPVRDIPRTTSGKLQRFKLLKRYQNGDFEDVESTLNHLLEQAGQNDIMEIVLPVNDLEKRLLDIWKSVLPTFSFGTTHRFFALGGNSLKAAEIGMLLWQEFQVELPFELLYEKQTIQELALVIKDLKAKKYQAFPIATTRKHYELSSSQKGLYYIWESDKTSIAYNTPSAFSIKGTLNVAKLEEQINKIIARHDSLRMSFSMTTRPQFAIADQLDFSLNTLDCTRQGLDEKLQSLVQPFDLTTLALFRIELVKISADENILFLDFHHIISDGLSVYHFLDELIQLYADASLPALRIQYKDYVDWEKDRLQTEKIKESEAFWKNHLAGELPILELPLDFPRSALFQNAGQKIEFNLKPETSRRLKALAQSQVCTLHVLLLTAYRLLLSKYTGQEDSIIGIPVGGRSHPELQNMQGMFVNSLAIRNTIDGEESFVSLLKREQENMTQSLRHQQYPFDLLLKKLGRKRTMSRNPVFDTMFVFQNMGLPKSKEESFNLSRHFFDPGFSKFDLTLEFFIDDGIQYSLEYATSLFKKERIVSMAQHFENLLEEILKEPARKISEFSLLGKEEYDRYIHQVNNTETAFPKSKTIYQLFEEQVERAPEKIAIVYEGQQISFLELKNKSEGLAKLLIEKGVKRNDIITLLLPRSPEFIIASLAVLKAGGTYLPLDTDLPKERIKFILEDSGSSLMISLSEYENQGPSINLDQVDLETLSRNSLETQSPAALAYIIYTSGTTGQPKGVMIKQQSLVNYICWALDQYVQGEKVAFPLFTSVSFDLTITSIFTPLISGNKIIIYQNGGERTIIEKVVSDDRVNVIKLTPSHLKILKRSDLWQGQIPSNIKRFIVGGELLESHLAQEIYKLFDKKVALYNEYGPTEATVGCMIHKFDEKESSPSVPIGVPAANTQIYVLDKFGKPVSEGMSGELYVSGNGLAAGYWNRDKLTAQSFIAHPFLRGARMYKTGDLVRWLPGQLLEYIERVDEQVKLNGYRIELSEIEQQLLQHELILDALVRLVENSEGQKILYAYYRSEKTTSQEVGAVELRNFLAERLPHYMMPVHFVSLEAIPLTINGKIDESALPKTIPIEEELSPESSIEELSVKVWEEVMGGKISVSDNFFELGGDSIQAVQIVSRLQGKGIALQVKDILTYQTIRQISLRAKIVASSSQYEQGIIAGEKTLSPIESWFFDCKFENPNHYNQSVLLRLNKPVDVALLEQAFKKLIEHHDALRLNYDAEQNKFYYNNRHLEEDFLIEEFILPQEKAEDFSVFAELKNKFDIRDSLLIKAGLARVNEENNHLCISVHHLVMDGISWRILLEDLYVLYHGVALPRKTASLIDWQKALLDYSTQKELLTQKDFWNSTDKATFSIPVDIETKDWQCKNRAVISSTLDEEQTTFLLKEAPNTYKTDVPILLNTALALALKDWVGGDRIIVEQENHGRHLEGIDLSRTIGWFTAMYPIELILEEGTIGEQIRSVKEQMRKVPGKGLGYGINKYLGLPLREPFPFTEIRFNYLGQFGQELTNDLFSYKSENSGTDVDPNNRMTAKLECNLLVVSGLLRLEINYNQLAHRKSTIENFNNSFLAKLQMILDHIKEEENIHFSPSDFDAITISQDEIDSLFE